MPHAAFLDPAHRDPETLPGDDFYRHANGGWLDANPVPSEYGAWGAFHEVHVGNEELLHELLEEAARAEAATGPQKMVGDYYASGMDVASIEATGLAPIADWLAEADAMRDSSDLLRLATRLRPFGIGLLFGVSVAADFEDSTRHLVYLSQSGLGLPERDYYLRSDERSEGVREAYQQHIAAMLELGGATIGAEHAASAVVELETAIAEVSLSAVELRDVDRTTNKTPVRELEAVARHLDLPRRLAELNAGREESVNLHEPQYFADLARIISQQPVESWKSYVRWHILRATASTLPAQFEDEAFDFYGKTLGGQREQKARWKRVLAAASGDIGEQVAQLYVAAAFSATAKQRCETLVGHLLEAMQDSIDALDWMSEETKTEALRKLEGFRWKIGYPDEWRDYTGLAIDRGPYAANRLRASRFEFEREIAKLGRPVESEWELPPHVVNAYYHPLHNEIVFPAGILQAPFFDEAADDAVNYGAIGAVIGHEITHGFDDQGSKFDAKGNLHNWWSETDRTEFEARAQGLVEQFNAFEIDDDLNVNGELTLGENIADLGGLSLAFDALQRAGGTTTAESGDLAAVQRFFMSYATIWRTNYTDEYLRLLVTTDPHSPGFSRCNGPLANFPPFAAAFGIDGDAPMARSEGAVVRIW
ncbi:MAG: M13 family metallopeptidase [Acidimicrobiia bacterium]